MAWVMVRISEFVRGQQFRGFTVERYDAIKERLGEELLVVIAFASERPEVLARFAQLDAEQQVVAPHLPLFAEEETVSEGWLVKHESELKEVYERLADEQSRKVFAATLNYKLSGKIKYLFDCTTEREADLHALIAPSQQECYLALAEELAQRGLSVEVHESGIWDVAGELSFSDSGGRQSTFIGASKRVVPVTTIDIVAAGRPISYIKMDVEGAEVQALAGGAKTISKYAPKLFVAAYHYDVDLFRLPQLMWQLVPDYKIYLRKHPYVPGWELNFIAVK